MVVRTFEPRHPRYSSAPPPRARRGWRWLLIAVAVVALALAGCAVAVAVWSGATLSRQPGGLARLRLQTFAGTLLRASAYGPDGQPIPLAVNGGRLTPRATVAPGELISVDVAIRRPSWLSWALGSVREERLTVRAPVARLQSTWLTVAPGAPVQVHFTQAVSQISYALPGQGAVTRQLQPAQRSVVLPGMAGAGSVRVAAAVRPWERLSAPAVVSWFPPARTPVVVADPAPGSDISPLTPLRLTFSVPVARLLGGSTPRLLAAAHGSWHLAGSHTIVFRPSGFGAPLGSALGIELPRAVAVASAAGRLSAPSRQLSWSVPVGSPVRLEQLLAQQGYLPVSWHAAGAPVARTARAQAQAAVAAPAGSFSWRYPNTPSQLRALWHPNSPNQIVRGAVMRFEQAHGLTADGIAGPQVWHALLADAVAGRRTAPAGYCYVYVRVALPQLLTLWCSGSTVLTSPGNTGIPQAPTQPGTFPVFEHIPVGTMSGTNPDGSHYNDPGVRWISYFNGGDALHAFPRASYGTPQSLGCVELPLAAAARVWPHTPIGTLVTIE